jgi:quercetin dioxygenase-like cupin family protein
MQQTESMIKRFENPDEVREFERGRSELVSLGDATLARFVFEPGWRWSEHVKPLVGTDSCRVQHTGYLLSGSLATRMDDGTEFTVEAGDLVSIPPGHDGWVVGDEPAVFVEIRGAEQYAKRAAD